MTVLWQVLGLLCYQPVLFLLPSLRVAAFVVQARMLPPAVSKLSLLILVEHLGDGGLLPPAIRIFFCRLFILLAV